MKKLILLLAMLAGVITCIAQKKPLDHSVYDSWQSIGKTIISNNGQWVAYIITVQEGDDELVVQSTVNNSKTVIPRGYEAGFTSDNATLIFKVKPLFQDIRNAKIKKKKADEMPRDSFALLTLATGKIEKYPNLISLKTPKESNIWVAGLFKNEPVSKPKYQSDKTKDSLKQIIDSLQYVIGSLAPAKGEGKDSITDHGRNNKLLLFNTATGTSLTFKNVSEYIFNKKGTDLLLEQTLDLKDTAITSRIVLYHLLTKKTDTLLRGGNDFKSLALSDDGSQAAFVAQRGAKAKALTKYYTLWHFKQGMDSARILVDTLTPNFRSGDRISEYGKVSFSRSGERLQFATGPARPPKDTSLLDIDKVNVDIWNYKDDYLQPYQLQNQKRERERSYTAVYDFNLQRMMPVGSNNLPAVYEGTLADARYYVAITDTGRRIASQWAGNTRKDVYKVDVANNQYIPAILNLDGDIRASWISPSGKYILWYDNTKRHYQVFDGHTTLNISAGIKVPLYDEENDVPDAPSPYGVMGWQDGDSRILIYDRYDIWAVDPTGRTTPVNLTVNGRKNKITYRYMPTDEEEDFIKAANKTVLSIFDNTSKQSGLAILENNKLSTSLQPLQPLYISQVNKAKNEPVYTYTKESYTQSPDLYLQQAGSERKLSGINPQQANYNWGTAALYQWKTFSGKPATGIIYKPENFDSTKKYPVILYFYEKLSDNLYKYIPPAPTPSRLNISFFVSRGYIVMTPDISYTIGYPAKSAYDYIVSGAQALAKNSWVDSKHMGIQGQSWGGIQVAQLVTMTDMFAAAWSGAPVANMTSAYGGIRWQTGMNRQFQYEKTQSRIGATLWDKPELYIENSPLFHLPQVNTPMVIMANDNDGAVPWYQGIELFTGMRRLGKQVWMLNYNGEEHNLMQRKNRKDIQIREQQFFDWLLKGDKPAKWLIEGVPAVDKGNSWGLETVH
ncbi:prolyl oligopeptidase family serine peptidase [Niabella yanshanensis]|uniref:Prolyl oligopeptidase family serine peptidase n=1 Tax=Niabella yanshanensis TaxID=577386 RepID=A0ABZ0W676_9BACT|nr:prolyl oligopeptidase family serine peptidase [Niabella yanshanensis]WQD37620.1 prolyl oligopeptidase family serine peptidase [Niabella yanshanensis]